MATIRVGTFNVENLFARYCFKSNVDPEKAVKEGWKADQRYFTIHDEESKEITAKTIREDRPRRARRVGSGRERRGPALRIRPLDTLLQGQQEV